MEQTAPKEADAPGVIPESASAPCNTPTDGTADARQLGPTPLAQLEATPLAQLEATPLAQLGEKPIALPAVPDELAKTVWFSSNNVDVQMETPTPSYDSDIEAVKKAISTLDIASHLSGVFGDSLQLRKLVPLALSIAQIVETLKDTIKAKGQEKNTLVCRMLFQILQTCSAPNEWKERAKRYVMDALPAALDAAISVSKGHFDFKVVQQIATAAEVVAKDAGCNACIPFLQMIAKNKA